MKCTYTQSPTQALKVKNGTPIDSDNLNRTPEKARTGPVPPLIIYKMEKKTIHVCGLVLKRDKCQRTNLCDENIGETHGLGLRTVYLQ